MTSDLAKEETTVIATYSTRRDAEIAHGRLDDENIQAFITADDAGGMHPQLQLSQGVHLVVLSGAAQRAREALQEADLLPRPQDDADPEEGGLIAEVITWSGIAMLLKVLVVLAIITALALLFFGFPPR